MEKINRDPKNPKWRKKSKWRQTWKFLLKKRLKRHLSSKFKTIFECNSMNINPMSNLNLWNFIAEFQDGDKIQNGAKIKKMFLLSNGQFSTDFKNLFCVLFVLLVSINNGWVWEFSIQDGGGNSKKWIFLKKSTFTKPPIIWEILRISTNPKRRNVAQPFNIYHLFLFFEILQDGGDFQDGVWVKFSWKSKFFSWFLFSSELSV